MTNAGSEASASPQPTSLPQSVTTPEAFYEVMARAALDGVDLRAILERLACAERELETLRETLKQADTEAANARHAPRPERDEDARD